MAEKRPYKAILTIPKAEHLNYTEIIGEQRAYERAGVSMKETDDIITVVIEAKDITALRASINSITRDVTVIENTDNASQ